MKSLSQIELLHFKVISVFERASRKSLIQMLLSCFLENSLCIGAAKICTNMMTKYIPILFLDFI